MHHHHDSPSPQKNKTAVQELRSMYLARALCAERCVSSVLLLPWSAVTWF